MIRIILAALIALATVAPAAASGIIDHRWGTMRFVTPKPAFPKAKNGVVVLHYMPGGIVGEHMRWAKVWADMGHRMVIADDQYSAAAMMVIAFKNAGGKVCARKGADLYFHLLANGLHPGVMLSRADEKRIGKLTHRFKRIKPAVFGIPRCK